MNNPRAEVEFKIGGETYKRRPTFEIIAQLEGQFGPILRIVNNIKTMNFGISDTADALITILGPPNKGGPPPKAVQDAVMEDYTSHLPTLARFLAEAITDPSAPVRPQTARVQ